jgi:hypothetical protein
MEIKLHPKLNIIPAPSHKSLKCIGPKLNIQNIPVIYKTKYDSDSSGQEQNTSRICRARSDTPRGVEGVTGHQPKSMQIVI